MRHRAERLHVEGFRCGHIAGSDQRGADAIKQLLDHMPLPPPTVAPPCAKLHDAERHVREVDLGALAIQTLLPAEISLWSVRVVVMKIDLVDDGQYRLLSDCHFTLLIGVQEQVGGESYLYSGSLLREGGGDGFACERDLGLASGFAFCEGQRQRAQT